MANIFDDLNALDFNGGGTAGTTDDHLESITQALIGTEGSDEDAVSPKGARGRLQIMPGTFRQYADPGDDFNDEAARVRAARRKITTDYENSLSIAKGDKDRAAKLTAAAYFGGAGGRDAWSNGKGSKINDGILNIDQYVDRFSSKLGLVPAEPDHSTFARSADRLTDDADIAGRINRQRAADEAPYSTSLGRGVESMASGAKSFAQTALGDTEGAGKTVAEHQAWQELNPAPSSTQEFHRLWQEGQYLGAVTSGGMGAANVEQLANSLPGMVGMAVGTLIGGPMVGGFLGAAIGNAMPEGGEKLVSRMSEAGVNLRDPQAISQYVEAHRGELVRDGLIKGLTVSAFDALALKAGVSMFGAPAATLATKADDTLVRMGVNLADPAMVKAAKASAQFKSAITPAVAEYKAATTLGRNAARAGGSLALESAGEFGGEYVGQELSGDEGKFSDALLEAVMAGDQSAVTTAGGMLYAKVKAQTPVDLTQFADVAPAARATAPQPLPTNQPNSPLSNAANAGQNTINAAAAPVDPFGDRVEALRPYAENPETLRALRRIDPVNADELLGAWAVARNPNINPRQRELALSRLEQFAASGIPNFTNSTTTPAGDAATTSPGGALVPAGGQRTDVGPVDPSAGSIPGQATRIAGELPGQPKGRLSAPDVPSLEDPATREARTAAEAEYEAAFADLLKAEQLNDRGPALLAKQQRAQEAEARLAEIRQTIEGNQRQQHADSRTAILDTILADDSIKIGNKAAAFASAIKKVFNAESATPPSAEELGRIRNYALTAQTFNQTEVEPSAPNELDPAALGVRERADQAQRLADLKAQVQSRRAERAQQAPSVSEVPRAPTETAPSQDVASSRPVTPNPAAAGAPDADIREATPASASQPSPTESPNGPSPAQALENPLPAMPETAPSGAALSGQVAPKKETSLAAVAPGAHVEGAPVQVKTKDGKTVRVSEKELAGTKWLLPIVDDQGNATQNQDGGVAVVARDQLILPSKKATDANARPVPAAASAPSAAPQVDQPAGGVGDAQPGGQGGSLGSGVDQPAAGLAPGGANAVPARSGNAKARPVKRPKWAADRNLNVGDAFDFNLPNDYAVGRMAIDGIDMASVSVKDAKGSGTVLPYKKLLAAMDAGAAARVAPANAPPQQVDQPPVLQAPKQPEAAPDKGAEGVDKTPADGARPLTDLEQAQADKDAALADLGAFFRNTGLTNQVIPEADIPKLIPVLTRLVDATFRLGYHSFKASVRETLRLIRENFGDAAADALTIDHLQGAYIAGVGSRAESTPKKEVVAFDSIDEVLRQDAPATNDVVPEIKSDLDAKAHEAATSPLNDTPPPTDEQKSAGNYKLGHVRVQGLGVSIENPRGSIRSGTSPDGKRWENTLAHHYGYFKGSKAGDGDNVDVFLTDGAEEAKTAWVIDQKNQDGSFDELKVVLGPDNEADARQAYLANYAPGWDGIGAVTSMPMEAFKAWVMDGKVKRKPLAYVAPAKSDSSLNRDSSWIIRNKETGEVVMETFDKAKVDALNTEKYEAVPALEYLGSLNAKAAKADTEVSALSDAQVSAVFKQLGLAGEKASAAEKRSMLGAEDPAEVRAALAALAEKTPPAAEKVQESDDQPTASRPIAESIEQGKSGVVIQGNPDELAEIARHFFAKGVVKRKTGITIAGKDKLAEVQASMPVREETYKLTDLAERYQDVTIAVFTDGSVRLNSNPVVGQKGASIADALAKYRNDYAGVTAEKSSVVAEAGPDEARSINPRTLSSKANDAAIQRRREIMDETRITNLGTPQKVLSRAWETYEKTKAGDDLAWLIAVDERVNGRALPDEFKSLRVGQGFLEKHGLSDAYEVFEDRAGKFKAVRTREDADEMAAGLLGGAWGPLKRSGWVASKVGSYSEAKGKNEPLFDEGFNGGKISQLAEVGLVIEKAGQPAKLDDVAERVAEAAPAAHIEPGDVEAATPAVVAASLKEGVRNTDLSLKEQQAYLLQLIDQAIAAAPTHDEQQDKIREYQRYKRASEQAAKGSAEEAARAIDRSNAAKAAAEIGFVTFDVPGDGKFKVLNFAERLKDFRKVIEKSAGFKESKPARLETNTGPGSGESTITDLLADGDLLAARELAAARDKPFRYGVGGKDGNKWAVLYPLAKPLMFEGRDMFVGRAWNREANELDSTWSIIDLESGVRFVGDHTEKEVIAKAQNFIKEHPGQIAGAVKKEQDAGRARTQDDLAADWEQWASENEDSLQAAARKKAGFGPVEPAKAAPRVEENPSNTPDKWFRGVAPGGLGRYTKTAEAADGRKVVAVVDEAAPDWYSGKVSIDGREQFRFGHGYGNSIDAVTAKEQADKIIADLLKPAQESMNSAGEQWDAIGRDARYTMIRRAYGTEGDFAERYAPRAWSSLTVGERSDLAKLMERAPAEPVKQNRTVKTVDSLNAQTNPVVHGDWIKLADDSEWEALYLPRMRTADGNSWSLWKDGREHPIAKDIDGDSQFIRAIIAADAAAEESQKPAEPAPPPKDELTRLREAVESIPPARLARIEIDEQVYDETKGAYESAKGWAGEALKTIRADLKAYDELLACVRGG